jgi:sugar lactone lactonase YvrE
MFNFDWSTRLFPQLASPRRGARRRKAKAAMPNGHRRPRLESLENRRLLSAVTVTTANDETDGHTSSIAALIGGSGTDGTISLREAILASNNTPGANSITFATSLAGTPIQITQGALLISNAVTITGLPAAGTTLDANYGSRIFDITAAAGAVTLDALTLTHGSALNGNGGAIYSASALTISDSAISQNFATDGDGAGIYALGDVTVKNSIVDNNDANVAAGIESVSGAVTVSNSTVLYNYGGGIRADHGSVVVSNSTVFNNYQFGIQAGTLASDGSVTIRSSIVAGDWARDPSRGFTGDLSSGSTTPATVTNSLIGDNSGSGLTEAPVGSSDVNGNFIGGPIHGVIDPMLRGGFYYNGGPTYTMMLLPGSPAIDTGANPDNLATDQRGAPFARTAGAKTDMGAFELQTSKFTPTLNVGVAGGVFKNSSFYPNPNATIAGVNGPFAGYLEGVSPTLTYYAGPTASGTPLPGPYGPSQAGTYTVVGSFAGSAEYAAATASATFTIAQAPTTTTVTSSSVTGAFGQYIRYDVHVGVAAGENGAPTSGIVTLWDGNTPLYSGFDESLDTGFVLNGLSVGTHTISATYSGDADFTGSGSSALSVVIGQASTTTTVASSSPNQSSGQLVGQDVTFTASVAAVYPGAGTPTGSVTFWDGATLLGVGTLDSSDQATFTTAALSVGTHTIAASYGGDTNFTASPASPAISQVIRRAENVTTVTSSAVKSTAAFGQSVTFTAHVGVVAPDTGVPTGTVQFQLDGQNLGNPAPLDASDTASLTTSPLPLGKHRVTAVYSGNTTVDTSTGLLPGTISTVAGNGSGQYLLPSPARAAVLSSPSGVAVDASGNLFIADFGSDTVRKLNAKTGLIATFGPPLNFQNSSVSLPSAVAPPVGLVCDVAGNLFVADTGDNVVLRISPAGVATTVAGTSIRYGGYSGDGGAATAAQLNAPTGLAIDAAGDLFIADSANGVIREVKAGIITTVAGGGYDSYPSIGDGGPATAAFLNGPAGIAVDSAGDLFIGDSGNYAIRKVDGATGIISTVAAAFYDTTGILALDSAGNLFVGGAGAVSEDNIASGILTVVAGNNNAGGYSGDGGAATAALFNYPEAFAFDASGDLFIADTGNNVIREVNRAGTINTVAGGGSLGNAGNGGLATNAAVNSPNDVAVDAAGDLFIADSGNNVIREVNGATGIITTVAGNGASGYSGDGGPATTAELGALSGMAVDAAGDLFIADLVDSVIREVHAATGIITTLAGNGTAGYSGDGGAATAAELNWPAALAVDSAGNLFIADSGNYAIRKVDGATGIISTVAGNGSTNGNSGDGGSAIHAGLSNPRGLAFDAAGDLFIATDDYYQSLVREVSLAGIITTVAGNGYGGSGYSGDGGPATAAQLNSATRLAFDAAGDLLIADSGNDVIRAVSPAGIITTVVGVASVGGYSGNGGDGGPATAAQLYLPSGVAVDASGDLFIADTGGERIREVTPSLLVTLANTTTAVVSSNSTSLFGQSVTFTVTIGVVAPGAGTPTGKVKFSDGNTFLGAGMIDNSGQVTLTTSILTPGTHTITASYSGDADFLGVSNALAQQVNPLTAANLQLALVSSPSIVVQAATDNDAHNLLAAVNDLAVPPNPCTVTLNLAAGTFTDFTASPTPAVTLVINGKGVTTTIVGRSPALTVASGNVIVSGVIFTTATDAPTVLVTGGALKLRNDALQESSGFADAALAVSGGSVDLGTTANPCGNTLNVNGTGELIHNSGLNPISALGDTFQKNGAALTSPYRVEDLIFHALDAGGGGLVTYVANNVYVTQASGSIQRGVHAVAAGGTVNVEAGNFSRFADYNVGAKPLAVSFQNGLSLSLAAQADTSTMLRVTGSPGFNHIEIEAGKAAGTVDVEITHLPTGTFAPTGRMVVHGGGDDAHIKVSDKVTLSALLFADGADAHLEGGGGTTIEVGGGGANTELDGGEGRNLLIAGRGPAHMEGGHDDDILIGGYTDYDANEAALWAIMAEWTHTYDPANALNDYQIRVAHLTGGGGLNVVGGLPVVLSSSTVHDNGVKDNLDGDGGRDLFFAALLRETTV